MSGNRTSSYAGWQPGWAVGALVLLVSGASTAFAQPSLPAPPAPPPATLPALLPDEEHRPNEEHREIKIIMTKEAMPTAAGQTTPAAAPDESAAGAAKSGPDASPPTTIVDPNVQQVFSCPCQTAAPGDTGPLPPVSPVDGGNNYYEGGGCGCGGSCCVPGKKCCHCECDTDSWYGRLWCGFYECICCEDHCYEPGWSALADSAFFTDAARPITQFKIAYERDEHMPFPDRGEYFMAHSGSMGVLPAFQPRATVAVSGIAAGAPLPFLPPTGTIRGKGLQIAEQAVNADQLMLITEAATGRAGIMITTPFEAISPENNSHASGYGDTTITTKSLLLDCELLQLTFAFKTQILSGNFTRGLGAGHVSIEPDLVLALKLGPCTSLQAELGEHVPLGGDSSYQSDILKYSFSLNHVLCKLAPDIQLIGTLEAVGMTFQNGEYTDPGLVTLVQAGVNGAPVPSGVPTGAVIGYYLPPQRAATTYFSAGPGVRFVMCNKLDIGLGTQFHLTQERYADEQVRFEFRYRF